MHQEDVEEPDLVAHDSFEVLSSQIDVFQSVAARVYNVQASKKAWVCQNHDGGKVLYSGIYGTSFADQIRRVNL